MDIYILQYINQSRYLVAINKNTYSSVYKFNQPFFSFQAKSIKFLKTGSGIYLYKKTGGNIWMSNVDNVSKKNSQVTICNQKHIFHLVLIHEIF